MKTKLLLTALVLAVLASLYLTYDRTVIRKDFEVTNSEEEEVLESDMEDVESKPTEEIETTVASTTDSL